MDANRSSQLEGLSFSDKITLTGQLAFTAGTALLSIGKILKLLETGSLPTTPVISPTLSEQGVSHVHEPYKGRRSYFDS